MQNNERSNSGAFRKFFQEKGYYIVLFLCILAVGISGYIFVRSAISEKNSLNDETLSVDVIKEVGPRSDFLAHMNTFENMYIQSKPKLIDRLTRDRWNEAGHLDMESRALIAAKELLATWEPEPLSEEACARVRAVLNAAERDYGVPESLE